MLIPSSSSLPNLLFLATISSSSLNIHVENYHTFNNYDISLEHKVNITDWKDNAFNSSVDYTFHNEDISKIETMLSITNTLLNNSEDIESEFVGIVNENFWDLI